jgi:hypothetical protein
VIAQAFAQLATAAARLILEGKTLRASEVFTPKSGTNKTK